MIPLPMAQKKKKALSSRPIAPQPSRALTPADYGAAIAAIMLVCGLIGLSLGLLMFSDSDQVAFSRAFSFGTPIDLGAILASLAFPAAYTVISLYLHFTHRMAS